MLATTRLNGLESGAWLKDTPGKTANLPTSRIEELLLLGVST